MDGISLNVMGNQIIDLYQKMKKKDPLPDQPEPSYLSYIEKESQYHLRGLQRTVYFGRKPLSTRWNTTR